jgi:hypothetical protein
MYHGVAVSLWIFPLCDYRSAGSVLQITTSCPCLSLSPSPRLRESSEWTIAALQGACHFTATVVGEKGVVSQCGPTGQPTKSYLNSAISYSVCLERSKR